MRCLECHAQTDSLDTAHLRECCGLTLQEYALRHGLALDGLVPQVLINLEHTPAPGSNPGDRRGQVLLGALITAGKMQTGEDDCLITGTVRDLDLLLWLQIGLQPLGFEYYQEYRNDAQSHRVVALNRLKSQRSRLPLPLSFAELSESERLEYAAVLVAYSATPQAGYIFLHALPGAELEAVRQWLQAQHHIEMIELPTLDHRTWLRGQTQEDSRRLVEGLLPQLRAMPGVEARLLADGPAATVVKEQGLDAAHFITDHPGACANLHGGHYSVRFKVHDRIDPATGFVMDYGYLKKVVRHTVINQLDHHTLNYAAKELTWRSSTEFLAIWIWQQVIHYLPALQEIEIHESQSSYCQYQGPTLEEFQQKGHEPLLRHFMQESLGEDSVRDVLRTGKQKLRLISG